MFAVRDVAIVMHILVFRHCSERHRVDHTFRFHNEVHDAFPHMLRDSPRGWLLSIENVTGLSQSCGSHLLVAHVKTLIAAAALTGAGRHFNMHPRYWIFRS